VRSQGGEEKGPEGLAEAVAANWNSLVRFAASQVGQDQAEDVVMEALLRAVERPTAPRSWSNWLFISVRYRCKDWFRQRGREERRAGGPIRSYEEVMENLE